MATPKIKLFQLIQSHFVALGLHTPPQRHKRCELNGINLLYFFELFGLSIPIVLFLFLQANSAYEYSNSAYVLSNELSVGVQLTAFLYRKGLFINLIENYQNFIEKRKQFEADDRLQ